MDMNGFVRALGETHKRISARITSRRRGASLPALDIALAFSETPYTLELLFTDGDTSQVLEVQKTRTDTNGNLVVGYPVSRAVGSWFLVDEYKGMPEGVCLGYWELMLRLLTEGIDYHFQGHPGVTKRIQLERLIRSFGFGNAPVTVRNTQRLLNSIVNDLPVCGTATQVWAMNNRIVFVDPSFEELSPKARLDYQEQKNREFFPFSSIGLSDTAASKNYLLTEDLRTLSPFALRHHNPMRNLYQTLGMTGDELPLLQTVSARKLENSGRVRTGYNWMTCFLETPLGFQDQLILSDRLQQYVHGVTKEYLAFGTVQVTEGDELDYGTILSLEPGNQLLVYHIHGDSARVASVADETVQFNNQEVSVKRIVVETKRMLKDGSKFTNMHGNKGVAVFTKTGQMYDSIRKKVVDIDVIVSSATIKSRRNFGQVLEALMTLVTGPGKRTVIKDDYAADINKWRTLLEKLTGRGDGTCAVNTPWGKFDTICGWVFWGLVKDPEDALWTKGDVQKRSNLGVRVSGVKLSHVELRALATNFGVDSNIIREVLSYQEGADIIQEYLTLLRSSRGKVRADTPVVDVSSIKAIDQSTSVFHTKEEFLGTLNEEGTYEEGLYLKLPFFFETRVPRKSRGHIEERVVREPSASESFDGRIFRTNAVYIPFADLRAPWQHQSGQWGLSDLGGAVNNLLTALHAPDSESYLPNCARVLKQYFSSAATRLSTKWGLLASNGMSVRYPNATKATAALSCKLPKNTIQIHSSLASSIGVSTGDLVLAERFPCLGFMSLRVQRVEVVDEESCRYVVRVSGNSLNSLDLDFDGDVLFLMSFKEKASQDELELLFRYPPSTLQQYIQASSDRVRPGTKALNLDEVVASSLKNGQPPLTFAPLTPETSSQIARALIGIKTGTGTSVALGYNILRVVEGACGLRDSAVLAESEMLLNLVANSVFATKHSVTRLLEREGGRSERA